MMRKKVSLAKVTAGPPVTAALTSAASERGMREHQEDRYVNTRIEIPGVLHGTGWLLAVLDGHGGKEVAEIASHLLPGSFKATLSSSSGDIGKAMQATIAALEEAVERIAEDSVGATLSLVYIPEDESQVYIAVLGDSPVIILGKGGQIYNGPNHNVRINTLERTNAIKKGGLFKHGYIWGYGLGLQMSRALGDQAFGNIINRTPEIVSYPLDKDSIVIVGSDGLFSPLSPDLEREARELIKFAQGESSDASKLLERALRNYGGYDNVTAVVWKAVSSAAKAKDKSDESST